VLSSINADTELRQFYLMIKVGEFGLFVLFMCALCIDVVCDVLQQQPISYNKHHIRF
jgi:hypothetical protein